MIFGSLSSLRLAYVYNLLGMQIGEGFTQLWRSIVKKNVVETNVN